MAKTEVEEIPVDAYPVVPDYHPTNMKMVPAMPIREVHTYYNKRKWFGQPWDTKTVKTEKKLEYYWNGEWKPIPVVAHSHLV
jgi:hypothetical protein